MSDVAFVDAYAEGLVTPESRSSRAARGGAAAAT